MFGEEKLQKMTEEEYCQLNYKSQKRNDMNEPVPDSDEIQMGLLNDVHRSIKMINGEMFGLISRIRDCVHKVIPFSDKDRKDNDINSMDAPSFREAMNIEISVTENNLNSLQAIYEHLQKIIN